MFPQSFRKVADTLKEALRLNKARAECFAAFIITAVEAKSILLDDVVKRLPGKALGKSKFHRLQDFFREVRPDFNAVARMIMGFVEKATRQPLVLAIDRTGWQIRGKHEYNLLVLSVCLGDLGLPLLWTDLHRLGNSMIGKRKRLLRRFLQLFGVERIHCLIGDREFNGKEWFAWLKAERIPFLMRLRQNTTITATGGTGTLAKHLFHQVKFDEIMDLGIRYAFKTPMGICATRTRAGELLILGYHQDLDGAAALALYRQRWNIETGFEKLKTHGFHLESSRLHGGGKIERVLAALALAEAWCYASGDWSVQATAPIKRKKHGRPEQSIFARGLELLASFLHGIAANLRQVALAVFAILRRAANAAR